MGVVSADEDSKTAERQDVPWDFPDILLELNQRSGSLHNRCAQEPADEENKNHSQGDYTS